MSMIRLEVLAFVRLLRSRIFAVALLSVSMAVTVYSLSAMTNPVYIHDGGETVLTYTIKKQPDDILKENGIITMAYDSVNFTGFGQGEIAQIEIQRAFKVSLTADGNRRSIMVTGGTVRDLLERSGIYYEEDDMLSHPLGMYLVEGDNVVLRRMESDLEYKEEVVPYDVEVRETSLIRVGRTYVLQEGQNGQKLTTYRHTMLDGEIAQTDVEEEEYIKRPVTKIVLQGTGAAISPLSFGQLDHNRKPVQYKKVLTNQIATGYSAGRGAWGASGMDLSYGYVAVDPAVIPYGTRMYIATPDNSFVYGYAIAADTGIGLLNGVINVDLYYNTYLESCLNGRRIVDIYILD